MRKAPGPLYAGDQTSLGKRRPLSANSGIELLLRPHRSNRENWIGSRGRTKEDTGAPVT